MVVLRDWLPEVIQQVDPWMSSENIDKGQRWALEIGAKLGELDQGILCVTIENVREPWLNFEAGALAKSLDEARVRPVLLDLQPSDIVGPLAQFQSTTATDRTDMLKLISSLNAACTTPLDPARLERAFERTWDDYVKTLSAATSASADSQAPLHRSSEDLLGELLERVRDMQRNFDSRPGRPLNLRSYQEVLLGDQSRPHRGMRVQLPDGRIGTFEAVLAATPSLANANDAIVKIRMDDGESLSVQSSDLINAINE